MDLYSAFRSEDTEALSLSIVISLMSVDHFTVYMRGEITRLCHSEICAKIGSCLSLYSF